MQIPDCKKKAPVASFVADIRRRIQRQIDRGESRLGISRICGVPNSTLTAVYVEGKQPGPAVLDKLHVGLCKLERDND